MTRRPPRSPLFPYPTLSRPAAAPLEDEARDDEGETEIPHAATLRAAQLVHPPHGLRVEADAGCERKPPAVDASQRRSEEHTSELQSRQYLVCRLLLEKKKIY